jgi:glycosyltransferase involved in cell wall biosynthesis
MKGQILIVGPLPPPRHGAATINESVARECISRSENVHILNTVDPSSGYVRSGKVGRLRVIAKTLRQLSRALQGASSVYMSVSGGFGMLYECLFAFLVRLHGKTLVLHHHSYRYLNNFFLPAWLLTKISGSQATHICLSDDMSARLQRKYQTRRTLILSNAAFLSAGEEERVARGGATEKVVVGLLSNLCPEKGLDDFLTICRQSAESEYPWKFRLAGPFLTKDIEAKYASLVRGAPNLDYVGAVYGDERTAFLQSLDVFLFPTRYPDEAEPLVVLEAMREGVPCIAFGRGSIPGLLKEGGVVVAPGDDFSKICLAQLKEWASFPTCRERVGEKARNRFAHLKEKSARSFMRLFELLSVPGETLGRVSDPKP